MKPVHPILVHFPIALLSVSVAADVLGHFANIESLRQTGCWTLLGAAIGGAATAAAGIYDMRRIALDEAVHHRVHFHMRVGLALAVVIIGLAVWRWLIYSAGGALPMLYLDLAVLTVALAGFQGWLGGELVYTDGVFVRAPGPGDAGAGAKPEGHDHQH